MKKVRTTKKRLWALFIAAVLVCAAMPAFPVTVRADNYQFITGIRLDSGLEGYDRLVDGDFSVMGTGLNSGAADEDQVWVGLQLNEGTPITNLIIIPYAGDSYDAEDGFRYLSAGHVDIDEGSGSGAACVYYTIDPDAGEPIVGLDILKSDPDSEKELLAITNDGAEVVRTAEGTPADLDERREYPPMYLLMIRDGLVRPYISEAAVVSAEDRANAVYEAASLGFNYYVDGDLDETADLYTILAYNRTADPEEAITHLAAVTESLVNLLEEGQIKPSDLADVDALNQMTESVEEETTETSEEEMPEEEPEEELSEEELEEESSEEETEEEFEEEFEEEPVDTEETESFEETENEEESLLAENADEEEEEFAGDGFEDEEMTEDEPGEEGYLEAENDIFEENEEEDLLSEEEEEEEAFSEEEEIGGEEPLEEDFSEETGGEDTEEQQETEEIPEEPETEEQEESSEEQQEADGEPEEILSGEVLDLSGIRYERIPGEPVPGETPWYLYAAKDSKAGNPISMLYAGGDTESTESLFGLWAYGYFSSKGASRAYSFIINEDALEELRGDVTVCVKVPVVRIDGTVEEVPGTDAVRLETEETLLPLSLLTEKEGLPKGRVSLNGLGGNEQNAPVMDEMEETDETLNSTAIGRNNTAILIAGGVIAAAAAAFGVYAVRKRKTQEKKDHEKPSSRKRRDKR